MPSNTAYSSTLAMPPPSVDSRADPPLAHSASVSISPGLYYCQPQPSSHDTAPPSPSSTPSVSSASASRSPRQASSTLFPPVSVGALRRLRGFASVDRLSHCGHVYLLKQSPSSLSLSLWKLRTAALAFGSIAFFRVSSSAVSDPTAARPSLASALLCSAAFTVVETDRLSLNYACLDVVGYDPASSLYLLRVLTELHSSHAALQLGRRWFTLGFTSKEDCRGWVNVITPAIAHHLSIHYHGDSVKVRLREPVEPPLPSTRSALQVRPRGYRGELSLTQRFEPDWDDASADDSDLVERKAGERRTATDDSDDEHAPIAFTLLLPSLPSPLSVDVWPSPLFAPYELPPASHLAPLLERLYLGRVGFGCLTASDRLLEQTTHSSLLFGEVLFPGVTKLMDAMHLDGRRTAAGAEAGGLTVVDLGSGVGKLCMQVFLQYDSVERVEGVELAFSRYGLGRQAMLELLKEDAADPSDQPGEASSHDGHHRRAVTPYHLLHSSASSTTIASSVPSAFPYPRTLTLSRGNLFHCTSALSADIVIIETLITADSYALLSRLLERMKPGMRLLTFGDIRGLWGDAADRENLRVRREALEKKAKAAGERREGEGEGEGDGEEGAREEMLGLLAHAECPFIQLTANLSKLDRFLTTWSQKKGHFFFLWRKLR